jgi:hypothetical protein
MTVDQFQVGHTYSTRSICNHDCIFSITVISRTAKTIKTACGKTLRVSEYNGVETVKPRGSYSMAPIITATDPNLERTNAKTDKSETVAEMLSGDEFKTLFDEQKQAEILTSLTGLVEKASEPVEQVNPTARIYNFSRP